MTRQKPPLYDTFGETIRRLRMTKGIAPTTMARKLGYGPQSLRDWEKGRCEPSVTKAARIAEFLGCELGDLIPPTNKETE